MTNIANNIANMNTTGFKAKKTMFKEFLVNSRGGDRFLNQKVAFVRDLAQATDYTEGHHKQTSNPLDVAIHGEGFFEVDTDKGNLYTRNGRFRLDPEGFLVTETGHKLLDDQGEPFQFGVSDTYIEIARDGTINTQNGVMGKINLVTFDNPQNLKKVAGNMFDAERETPKPAEKPDISQGYLEASNVQGIIEMTKMIEVSRAYTSVGKMIQKEDERIKKVVELMKTQA